MILLAHVFGFPLEECLAPLIAGGAASAATVGLASALSLLLGGCARRRAKTDLP